MTEITPKCINLNSQKCPDTPRQGGTLGPTALQAQNFAKIPEHHPTLSLLRGAQAVPPSAPHQIQTISISQGSPRLPPSSQRGPSAHPHSAPSSQGSPRALQSHKKKKNPGPAPPSPKLTEPELPRAYPLPASLTEGSPSTQSRKGTPRHSVPARHLLTEGPRAPRTCRTSPEGAQLRRRALLPAPATAPPPPPHDFKPNGRPGPPIRERRSRRARQSEERAAGGGRGQRRA